MADREGPAGLTVLQVLSWLNYGGVERYAIRLARALKDRGHRVLVASAGGQLTSELEALHIDHFQIDFTGWRTLSGARKLRRLIEQEHVDLVNAHNWRAGMVSYLACRAAGVPYLLTIHGVRHPLHRHAVFYWSDPVIVVSEPTRRNLVEGFRLPESHVVRSLVGVECDRFHPEPPDPALESELGLRSGAPRVVHVTRYSHSKAPVSLALIAAAEAVCTAVPDVEFLLVGQGPLERAVVAAAAAMNQRLGRRAVIALPGRADIPRLLNLGGVVVGTASVALEAMACGRPLIAAGKAGYFGPVTPENLEEAEQLHFADHAAHTSTTPACLAADLIPLLSDPGRAADLGRFGRRTALSRYSTARLADDVETIYARALCRRDRVQRVLVFHLNQIGDLMFTLPALKALREGLPQAHIISVLRPHLAGLLADSPFVDQVVPRPAAGPCAAFALAARLRRESPDLVIAFSQSASTSISAWLSRASHRVGYIDADLARLLNHRVQLRGIPRPEKVLRLVRALGLTPRKTDYVGLVHLSGETDRAGERILSDCGLEGDGPLVALAPGESEARPYKSWTADGFRAVAARLAREEAARLVVVGAERDRPLGDEILAGLDSPGRANLSGRTTPAELAAVLARCDLLIGIDSGPMHVAAAMGTPVVGLFGPTDPARTGPMGEGHEIIFHRQDCWRPCIHPVVPTCTDRKCMNAISPDEVVAAARRILARSAARPAAGK